MEPRQRAESLASAKCLSAKGRRPVRMRTALGSPCDFGSPIQSWLATLMGHIHHQTIMLKRFIKAVLRPFVAPLLARVSRRVAADLEPLGRDVDALKGYTPILLSTIASQSAAERHAQRTIEDLSRRLDQTRLRLEERVEFVRKEALFELRYGSSASTPQLAEPRILNTEKRRATAAKLRLNIGCGHLPRDGYLNVDVRELPGVDIVADIRNLPFEKDQVAEIYSAHLLEHFPVEQLSRELLPYWLSLLMPGGRFVAVVPDAETMLAEHAVGHVTFDDLREVTFGGQEYEGDFHFNMFSHQSICEML